MRMPLPLVVFSHLRWNFVYQRPQHLLSRLAAHRRILFIEEPLHQPGVPPSWELARPEPNVLVGRLHTPLTGAGFADDQLACLRDLLPELLQQEGVGPCVAWFYSPPALPLRDALDHRATVFDCMDELSAFRFAPPELVHREAELLRVADLVFTGGPSLYRAKKDRHPNVHCFASSVDARHFGRARDGLPEAADQARLPRPRLGFFGVIDERFDVPLLDALARAHPEWQLVMVGPVVKIDERTLPRHPNIHYFGQRGYDQLPAYLAGWDVCLLPFARNEATRYISPTKTLEYMAAEKPIVSTPITDVAEPYGHVVYLGDTPQAFLAACERALAAGAAERAARAEQMRAILAQTSWDATAGAMEALIERAVAGRDGQAPAAPLDGRRPPLPDLGRRRFVGRREAVTHPVIVVGAGPTGLSATYHLGEDALLLEKNDRVGGWCRSVRANGFTFDFAGHIMFSNDPYVHELYGKLLGDNVHWQDREAWTFSKGVYTRYPFQGALYGLPPQVIKECIVGAIEARFGSLKESKNGNLAQAAPKANGNGKACDANGSGERNGKGKRASGKEGGVSDCCADGILESTARLGHAQASATRSGTTRPWRPWPRTSATIFGRRSMSTCTARRPANPASVGITTPRKCSCFRSRGPRNGASARTRSTPGPSWRPSRRTCATSARSCRLCAAR
jgi:UDP-galactopyranose mutase